MGHVYQHLARSMGVEVCLVDIISKYAADSDIFRRGGGGDSYEDSESAFLFGGRTPSDEKTQRGTKSFFAPGTCLATRKVVHGGKKALRRCTCP